LVKNLRSSGNVVKVIDNLERDGLVLREQNKSDRRAYLIVLTKKGKRLINAIFPNHVDSIIEAFSILSKEEQTELSRLCKKIGLMDSNLLH